MDSQGLYSVEKRAVGECCCAGMAPGLGGERTDAASPPPDTDTAEIERAGGVVEIESCVRREDRCDRQLTRASPWFSPVGARERAGGTMVEDETAPSR